ncbi:unnamed protein product [Lactuca saligna]|uniref:Uncharacterized protein n=1 Tax=Lactuca saligna TaxID=75948 RepID=A0AA35ZL95_LACSI|nr:unnamed protein product [Lactuca saligna]
MYNQSLMLQKQKATQPTTKPKSSNETMEEKGFSLLHISSDMVQGINSSEKMGGGEGIKTNATVICAPIMADTVDQMLIQMNSAKSYGADLVLKRENRQGALIPMAMDTFRTDLLLLASTNIDGVCYIETANLDGETNLMISKALEKTWDYLTPEKASEIKGNDEFHECSFQEEYTGEET